MSNKQSKRKNQKKHRRLNPRFVGLVTIAAALLLAGVIIWAVNGDREPGNQGTATGNFNPVATKPQIDNVESVGQDLGKNLEITDIGSYTGVFMEDGSDEVVSRVLMIVVKNNGEKTVQYGQIALTDGTKTANFTVTTLPPGESAVLLEQSRMSYADGKDLTQSSVSNVAVFGNEPGLCQDQLKIQSLNGAMNITNISGEDITGDIVIYYKNASSDMLYGGITYRVTIKGGLKADEVRQITAGHFSATGSRIMFVTCG